MSVGDNALRPDPARIPEVEVAQPLDEVARVIVAGGAFQDEDALRLAHAYLELTEEPQL